MIQPLPVVVVVDSRNVFHQIGAALGEPVLPEVAGVAAALEPYGFDVRRVEVGLALPRRRDRNIQSMRERGQVNEDYRARIEADPRGKALIGALHHRIERDSRGRATERIEEKQVDVACAVSVCKWVHLIATRQAAVRGIVVCSQDTDLAHAYKYAAEVGVPIWVAGYEHLESRAAPHIMLTERAFRSMAQVDGALVGHALRRVTALAVMAYDEAASWNIVAFDRRRKSYRAQRPDGLTALVPEKIAGDGAIGREVTMYPAGLDLGRDRSEFPVLRLGLKPLATQRRHMLRECTVKQRHSMEKIRLTNTVGRLVNHAYPLGGIQPGSTVLVDVSDALRPVVIGCTSPLPSPEICEASVHIVKVQARLSATQSSGRWHHQPVMILHTRATAPQPGHFHGVAMIDTNRARPTTQLITARL